MRSMTSLGVVGLSLRELMGLVFCPHLPVIGDARRRSIIISEERYGIFSNRPAQVFEVLARD